MWHDVCYFYVSSNYVKFSEGANQIFSKGSSYNTFWCSCLGKLLKLRGRVKCTLPSNPLKNYIYVGVYVGVLYVWNCIHSCSSSTFCTLYYPHCIRVLVYAMITEFVLDHCVWSNSCTLCRRVHRLIEKVMINEWSTAPLIALTLKKSPTGDISG